ncbi:MAG: T9SS type A sorting domain-containing protein [Bacteroidales bacterium]|nr:T9SS type A sorting domain-containing protein [Bacteroidales bacterium]
MKTHLLLSVLLLLSGGLFSQNLISYTTKYASVGYFVEGTVSGYKTHFSQVDSISVKLASSTDTISFKVKTYGLNNSFHIYNSQTFLTIGIYDLYVETDMDGWMILPQAVCVTDYNIRQLNEVRSNWRFSVDTTVEFVIHTNGTSLYPGTFDSAYFVRPNQDTIFVDSLTLLTSRLIKFYFHIPDSVIGGYYDLFAFNAPDTLLLTKNAIFISNDRYTQIASVSPDSINNLGINPIELIVYGSYTHFMADSNAVLISYHDANMDSISIVNDSLLKCYLSLPMPMKNVVSPNTKISIYNPTDGLLQYPFRLDMYSAIENKKTEFNDIKCYPNPSSDFIQIECKEFLESKDISLSIYSASGVLVKQVISKNRSCIQIDISDLSTGLYFISVQDSKRQKTIKFIKQ